MASTYLSYAHSLKEFSVSWSLTLLGQWGDALREMDAGIALAEKNGDPYRGHTLLMSRAWALLWAMDFGGARAIAESLLPALQHRAPWRRFCLVIAGAADAELGNHERALDRLLLAGEEMDRHLTLGDWYWRLVQRWALTSLWLSRGDVARAGETAEALLAGANATAERTWQALAWQTNARVALLSSDPQRAQTLIDNALAAIDGFDVPVAAWQVTRRPPTSRGACGDPIAAQHLSASRNIILKLAESLGPRRTLAATSVCRRARGRANTRRRNRVITKPQPQENDFGRATSYLRRVIKRMKRPCRVSLRSAGSKSPRGFPRRRVRAGLSRATSSISCASKNPVRICRRACTAGFRSCCLRTPAVVRLESSRSIAADRNWILLIPPRHLYAVRAVTGLVTGPRRSPFVLQVSPSQLPAFARANRPALVSDADAGERLANLIVQLTTARSVWLTARQMSSR